MIEIVSHNQVGRNPHRLYIEIVPLGGDLAHLIARRVTKKSLGLGVYSTIVETNEPFAFACGEQLPNAVVDHLIGRSELYTVLGDETTFQHLGDGDFQSITTPEIRVTVEWKKWELEHFKTRKFGGLYEKPLVISESFVPPWEIVAKEMVGHHPLYQYLRIWAERDNLLEIMVRTAASLPKNPGKYRGVEVYVKTTSEHCFNKGFYLPRDVIKALSGGEKIFVMQGTDDSLGTDRSVQTWLLRESAYEDQPAGMNIIGKVNVYSGPIVIREEG